MEDRTGIDDTGTRLARLEHAYRRLRAAAATALLVLTGFATLGFAGGQDDAQAAVQGIELRDAQGRVRIRLGIDDHGRAELRMLDARGRQAFSAVVPDEGGVSLRLEHAGGNFRTSLDGAGLRVSSSSVDAGGRMLKMGGREIRLDGETSTIEVRDNAHELAWSAP